MPNRVQLQSSRFSQFDYRRVPDDFQYLRLASLVSFGGLPITGLTKAFDVFSGIYQTAPNGVCS